MRDEIEGTPREDQNVTVVKTKRVGGEIIRKIEVRREKTENFDQSSINAGVKNAKFTVKIEVKRWSFTIVKGIAS